MIISKETEKFDNSTKILLYDKDEKGNCVPKQTDMPLSPQSAYGLGDDYYKVKKFELERLMKEVIEGKITIIKMYIEMNGMDEKDVADRIQIPYKKLQKYLTVEGFKNIEVKTLIHIAELFDIGIADLFQFVNIDKLSQIEIKNYSGRLIQEITFKN